MLLRNRGGSRERTRRTFSEGGARGRAVAAGRGRTVLLLGEVAAEAVACETEETEEGAGRADGEGARPSARAMPPPRQSFTTEARQTRLGRGERGAYSGRIPPFSAWMPVGAGLDTPRNIVSGVEIIEVIDHS